MLSIGWQADRTTAAGGAWASLLEREDHHVAGQRFGAGVLVVDFGAELLRHVDEDARRLTEVAILAVIDRHLGWTDRSELIAPGRLGVVAVPIAGPEALVRRARELHKDLAGCGLEVDVAYALRRRTGGLASAAARADAALDNALSRRTRARN